MSFLVYVWADRIKFILALNFAQKTTDKCAACALSNTAIKYKHAIVHNANINTVWIMPERLHFDSEEILCMGIYRVKNF